MGEVITCKLEDICLNEKGSIISGPFGSNISSKYFVENGIPVIRGNNLTTNHIKFIDDGFVYVTENKANELRCDAYADDLIFTAAGTIGQVGIIPRNSHYERYVISNKQIRVRLNNELIDLDYAYYWFSSPWIQTILKNNNKGSTVPLLTLAEVKMLPITYPKNKSEQRKIANVLSNLDLKMDNNTSICSEFEGMAKLLYDYWFVQFDFPDENGKPYKSSGEKMVWNEELKREIPEGWEVGIFKDVLEIGNGKDHKALNDGNIPVYGSGGLMRKVDSALYEGESVLIPRKGTLNNIMYVNEAFWTVDTMYYTKMKGSYLGKYMYYATKIYDFERLNTGTGVPSMTTDIIYKLKVIIPPSSLLKRFDEIITPWYKAVANNKSENQQLASLRDFLLPMLINGQVKVGKAGV